jgi:hypothetical protein
MQNPAIDPATLFSDEYSNSAAAETMRRLARKLLVDHTAADAAAISSTIAHLRGSMRLSASIR